MNRSLRISSPTAAVLVSVAVLFALTACNEHPVSLLEQQGAVEVIDDADLGGGQQLDVLWMIDNSGSMCRSQEILRRGVDEFVQILHEVNIDFHLAVTTTHMVGCEDDRGCEFDEELDEVVCHPDRIAGPDEEDEIEGTPRCHPRNFEPVSRAMELQATPQPIPGFNDACFHDIYSSDHPDVTSDSDTPDIGDPNPESVAPLAENIETAVECTENPEDYQHLVNFDEDRLRCALTPGLTCDLDDPRIDETSDFCLCPGSDGHPFTNCIDCDQFDPAPQIEGFFPDPADYRDIPVVLRSEDYQDEHGILDVESLRADFACMSLVGTRGDGIERGLDAVTGALSPELTGGPEYSDWETAEENRDRYPNAGFIRPHAETGLVFVTDENDCSHEGDLAENTHCGVHNCTMNEDRPRASDDWRSSFPDADGDGRPLENHLTPVEELAEQFTRNLAKTRYGSDADIDDIDPESILPASIHGRYQRTDPNETPLMCPGEMDDVGADPTAEDLGFPDSRWEVPISCASQMGIGWSGHRYEYFLRNFPLQFPTAEDGLVADNFQLPLSEDEHQPLSGEVCSDFTAVLEDIADFFRSEAAGCFDNVYACHGPEDVCPAQRYGDEQGEAGECTVYPAFDEGDDDALFYCDTGIEVRLAKNDEDHTRETLEATGYCYEDSFGEPGFEDSCVIKPEFYEWAPCESRPDGLTLEWTDTDNWLADIGEFRRLVRYTRMPLSEDEPSENGASDQNDDPQQNDDDGNQQDDQGDEDDE